MTPSLAKIVLAETSEQHGEARASRELFCRGEAPHLRAATKLDFANVWGVTMRPKALLVLLLSGCATGRGEQLALAPTTARAEPPLPVEPPPAAPELRAPAPTSSVAAPVPAVPAASGEPPGAVWPPPGGWDPPPCEVEASTTLVQRGAAYEVTAHLKNRTKRLLEFDVPDRCPHGPADFHGLGERYDYYGTCAAGACLALRPPLHVRIAPGQTIAVATVRIEPNGNGCNAPLEPGAYAVSFEISTGRVLCGGPEAQFERTAALQKPRASTLAKKCPQQPSCGIACPGGNYARDENGCSTCGCSQGPSPTSPTSPSEPARLAPAQ